MKKLVVMMGALAMTVAAVAAQCEATTLLGAQCKRDAQEGSTLCWQHAKLAGANKIATCQAKTASGELCSRKVEAGAKFCWQHAKDAKTAAAEAGKAAKAKMKAQAKDKADAVKKPVEDAKTAVTAGQCEGTTQAGERCKRKAVAGTKFCAQHAAK